MRKIETMAQSRQSNGTAIEICHQQLIDDDHLATVAYLRANRPSMMTATLPSMLHRYVQDRLLGTGSSVNASVNFMRDRLGKAKNLFRKDLHAHYGCVNAIEFSDDGSWLVSGGDDRRVLLWNVERAIHGSGQPTDMKGEHSSNIFCLAFDNINSKIFSAGNDEQVIVHDMNTGETLDVFLHEEAVYGISVDPLNSNVFASACDDGRVLIFDIREPASTDPFCLASYSSAFHAVMYNPVEPRLLATANSKEGVNLWDVRHPHTCLLKYGSSGSAQSCMSVRFNQSGTRILALRRRLPPVLFDVHSAIHAHQFDHKGYYNSCTMKSCCFAGDDDQYVLSGSDDFNLYMWKIPKEGTGRKWIDEAHVVLRGHRSIVNQVRFNTSNFLLASSGVEKIIKLWSPFTMPHSSGGLCRSSYCADKERKVYTHMEYINMVIHGGQVMTHDYSQRSTQEDPRMMAFFDSLVQREIEGLVTDDEDDGGDDDESDVDDDDANSSGRSNVDVEENGDSWLNNLAGTAILSDIGVSADSSESQNNDDDDENNVLGDSAMVDGHNNPDISSDSQPEVPNTISLLILQKRKQLLETVRANIRRELEQEGRDSRSPPLLPRRIRRFSNSSSTSSMSSSTSSSSSSTPTSKSQEETPEITRNTTIATSPSTSSSPNSFSTEDVAGPSSSSSYRDVKKCRERRSKSNRNESGDDRRKSLRNKRRICFVSDNSTSESDSGMDAELQTRRKRSRVVEDRKITPDTVETKDESAASTPDSGVIISNNLPTPTSVDVTVTKVKERFKRIGRASRDRRQYRSAQKERDSD